MYIPIILGTARRGRQSEKVAALVLAKAHGKLPKDLSADLARIVYNKDNFYSARRAYVYAATALMLAGESSLIKLM